MLHCHFIARSQCQVFRKFNQGIGVLEPQEPAVSIVISVYRRRGYLRDAIASALAQTFENIEVLVAEDGGSDCAAAVIESFRDSRLRLCRCQRNLGEAGNRVCAYRQARGRYLVNLDDDDILRPPFVASLIEPLEKDSRLVLAFCDHEVIDSAGRVDPDASDRCTRHFGRDKLSPGICHPLGDFGPVAGNIPLNVAAMFRRELVLPWGSCGPSALPDRARAADDLFLNYLACCSDRPAYYLPQRLAQYRVHDEQLTAQRRVATARAIRFCHHRFLPDSRLRRWRAEIDRQFIRSTMWVGIDLLRAGSPVRARPYLASALWRKLNWRAAAGFALTFLPARCTCAVLRGH